MRYIRAFRLALAMAALSFSTTTFSTTAFSTTAFSGELFAKGAETFKIQTAKGETPSFRVLSDSMSKRALAIGVITLINADKSVQPKLPMTDYVDLKFQSLVIEPVSKTPDKLQMTLKISGNLVELNQTINRESFVSGKVIEVKYPRSAREIMMYNVESEGQMKLKWEKKEDRVVLDEVRAKLSFEPLMGESEVESVKFSALGKRQK